MHVISSGFTVRPQLWFYNMLSTQKPPRDKRLPTIGKEKELSIRMPKVSILRAATSNSSKTGV